MGLVAVVLAVGVVWALMLERRQTHGVQAAAGNAGAQTDLLKQVALIDLPGPVGKRFDYLTIDLCCRSFEQMRKAALSSGLRISLARLKPCPDTGDD